MFSPWVRSLVKWINTSKRSRRGQANRSRPLPTCRPTVERLEDRLVPALAAGPSLSLMVDTSGIAPGGVLQVPIDVTQLSGGGQDGGLTSGVFNLNYDGTSLNAYTAGGADMDAAAGLGPALQSDDGSSNTSNDWTTSVTADDSVGQMTINLTGAQNGGMQYVSDGTKADGYSSSGLDTLLYAYFTVMNAGSTEIDVGAGSTISDGPYILTAPPLNKSTITQTVNFTNLGSTTTFTLSVGNATTAPIAYSPTLALLQSNIQTAIDALPNLGPANNVQTVAFNGGPTGGSFTLAFNNTAVGGTVNGATSPISYSTSPAILQANAQTSVDSLFGKTNGVSNAVASVSQDASRMFVTFQNVTPSSNEPLLTAASTAFTGGTNTSITVTGNPFRGNVQNVNFNSGPTGGTFTLGFNNLSNGGTINGATIPITYSTNAASLQASAQAGLDSLFGQTNGVSNAVAAVTPDASRIYVTLQNGLGATVEPTIGVVTANLTGTGGIIPGISVDQNPAEVTAVSATSVNITLGPQFNGLNFGSFALQATSLSSGLTVAVPKPATITQLSLPGTINSGQLALNAAPKLALTGIPTSATAGRSFSFTVTAQDASNNTVTGYAGTVHFTSSDFQLGSGSTLPADYTFTSNDHGVHVFTATLDTIGNQTLTVTDTVNPALFGTSPTIAVVGATTTHFAIIAPTNVSPGSPLKFAVRALDQFGNIVPNYTGTVHFTSSDSQATTLPNSTLAGGIGVFVTTLKTVGSQTLTVTDTATPSLTGQATANVGVELSIPTTLSAARGAVVTVPVNVNALYDAANGHSGLVGGNFNVFYNPADFTASSSDVSIGTITTNGSTSLGNGYSPAVPNGWTVTANLTIPGEIQIGLQNSGGGILTSSGTGSLVTINFHVKSTAPETICNIDLGADTGGGGSPFTGITDQNFIDYTLNPRPKDNTTLSPSYAYTGTDPTDGDVDLGRPTTTVLNGSYSITERSLSSDPSLTVAATGVLTGAVIPGSDQVQAAVVSQPQHGTVTLNANGAFVYTPSLGYLGTDSFTYDYTDVTYGYVSNVATVALTVTSRLSIPTNLTASPGATVVVPVNIDNPNPAGTGGLIGATLAIDYDPTVFTVANADIQLGTITSGWSLTPNVNATTGQLGVTLNTNGAPVTSTVGGSLVNITFHTKSTATLGTSPINLAATNTPSGSNTVTTVLDTQSGQLALRPVPTNQSNDVGVDGVVTVVAAGASHFTITAPTSTSAGAPLVFTVTALDQSNNLATGYAGTVQFSSSDGQAGLPLNAALSGGSGLFAAVLRTAGNQTLIATDTAIGGITGTSSVIAVTPTAATHLFVTAPSSPTAGSPVSMTVTAEDQFGNPAPSYRGMVHFTKSDTAAGSSVPANYTFVAGDNGVHIFTSGLTFATAGGQSVTATDTTTPSITGTTAVTVGAAAATHFMVAAPGTTTAGTGFVFSVIALDQFNNVATTYSGTVHFTSSDGQAALPADSTLAAGQGNFAAILRTAGTRTITATDLANGSLSATSTIGVAAAAATSLLVTGGTATAGTSFGFTVTAQDPYGNTATSFTGTVHFTSSDPQVATGLGLPANSTLTAGTGTFNATFKTAGTQTLTATSGTVSGNAAVLVHPPNQNPAAFVVSAVSSTKAGNAFVFTVTALDQFGNIATGYTDTVHFSSSDSQAGLPSDTALAGGTGLFAAALRTAGSQTITVTDTVLPTLTTTTQPILVSAAATNHFTVGAPATAAANVPFSVVVTAIDAFGNPTGAGYTGTVHLSSSDPAASLGANSTLTAGMGTFFATLSTPGSQTIVATDTGASNITGTATVILGPNPVTHFMVSGPSGTTAGSPLALQVTAEDANGHIASSYSGTVRFTSSDGQASLPANGTLTNGIGFFAGVLKTVGSQTFTATDTASGATGVSNAISVSAAAATHLAVMGPSSAVTGSAFPINVTALDAFGNIAVTYGGTVGITSSDAGATLPTNSTLTGGLGTFTAALATPGNQTFTATDTGTGSITGTSNAIAARGLVVTGLTLTTTGFIATFDKPFDPSQINLYDAGGNNGIADVALVGPAPSTLAIRGTLLLGPGDTTITFVKSAALIGSNFNPGTGVLASGAYALTIRGAANAFKDLSGSQLEGNFNGTTGTPGTNYLTTFVVGTSPVVVGIPGFARGPSNPVIVPNNAASTAFGIPLNISNGANVTQGQFTLQYNASLLTISGVTVNPALTGATLVPDPTSSAGNAVIDFTSSGPLGTGVVRLGTLQATVPDAAAAVYRTKSLLHFAAEQLNGGAIAVEGDDAVQVVAYFGDVNGDGNLSGADATALSQANAGTGTPLGALPGFAVFPNLDPAIIGDLSGNGSVDSPDITLINSFLAGVSHTQLPSVNPNGLTITPTGPDPALSLPTALAATPGSTITVPVDIDTARPAGSSGMLESVLALRYDPRVFSVSAADVQLGTLPAAGSGWQLTTMVNAQTGEIGIDLFSSAPIQTTAGGSLVTISLHVRDSAPAGTTGLTLVTQVNPIGQRVFRTEVADAQGAFVLHPALTAGGIEPGAPGQVTVISALGRLDAGAMLDGGRLPVDGKADLASSLSNDHNPQAAVLAVEQFFANLDPLLQGSEFASPGPLLDSELGLPGASNGTPITASESSLALGRGQGDAWLTNPQSLGVEEADPAGLDAFFAREGAETRPGI